MLIFLEIWSRSFLKSDLTFQVLPLYFYNLALIQVGDIRPFKYYIHVQHLKVKFESFSETKMPYRKFTSILSLCHILFTLNDFASASRNNFPRKYFAQLTTEFNDVTFGSNIVFNETVGSLEDCMLKCKQGCATFTFTKTDMRCVGYGKLMTSSDATTPALNTKVYTMTDRRKCVVIIF